MRFRARRVGPYNEYLYTFFKCLAPDRLMYAEGWYADKSHDEEDIPLGDSIVQRRCPHLRGRPWPVRRDQRHHAHLHHARLAVRPDHRPLPVHRRRVVPAPLPSPSSPSPGKPGRALTGRLTVAGGLQQGKPHADPTEAFASAVTVTVPIFVLAAGAEARGIREPPRWPDERWERDFAAYRSEHELDLSGRPSDVYAYSQGRYPGFPGST